MSNIKLNLDKVNKAKILAKKKATESLWRRGSFVKMVLNEYQQGMMDSFDASESIMYFLLCSRRIGKTWVLSTAALRQCFMYPGSRVLYLSTTTEQVTEICDQTFNPILETCPDDLRPEHKKKYNKYVFSNGSEIRIKGLDKVGPDILRGVKAHLVIFDEACFMKGVQSIINSVIMPMVI